MQAAASISAKAAPNDNRIFIKIPPPQMLVCVVGTAGPPVQSSHPRGELQLQRDGSCACSRNGSCHMRRRPDDLKAKRPVPGYLYENIKLFRLFSRSKIDFGQFDPMFPLNAALDRSTIPLVCRLSA